ncbi:MAG: hypothetical protein NZO16_06500 [Deltaproteobacteria bacterium]|nr:hypothetical protein [Deltaproteobacteria bacterium]
MNLSGAELPANALIGQISGSQIGYGAITNDKIQGVDWSKINVQDQEIPWKKLNTLGLDQDDLPNVPYYTFTGSSSTELSETSGFTGYMFPVGLNQPTTDLDGNLVVNHGSCTKFAFSVKQSAPQGDGNRRKFFLYSDEGSVEESYCVVEGDSSSCDKTFQTDQLTDSFGVGFVNETVSAAARASWQIVCAN